ncbi:hypothetical protein H257_16456 [Aphanomyces astaci]|uniref:Uncharacterized protein n=1 Tax=Aphanomyces astaci TaxID=112090 RepID=W4FKH5_APHAT|nr:hypothetical protein H257_16456 [Aphanomyces astaci]ETV67371.1 hypothetical protein H257_16456 [Aphanomyces astaci]|eukprot:XP_009843186.1 hypothetical protein H257_16456 [Aphanomyces astaci]
MPSKCRNKISPQKKPRRRYTKTVKRAMLSATKLLTFDGTAKWFNLDGAGRPEENLDTAAIDAFMRKLRGAKRT